MNSQIPRRRTTRATNLQQDENAVSRRQPMTRGASKASGASSAVPASKPANNTVLGPNAENKRKREAFGEVTNKNTKPAPRRPAAQASKAAAKSPEDAMMVDKLAVPARQRVSRRVLLRPATSAATIRRTRSLAVAEEVEDNAELRAVKKRRTSSEAGEEDALEAEADAEEVDDGTQPPAKSVEVEEEEEEVKGWDDLDADEMDDPLMVSEYVVDIFKYLSECEEKTLPKPNYMQYQAELRWSQRAILMDYLIGLHSRFRLCQETLYLAVNLIDRFLSMRVVSLVKLQLVGLACLFVASKFEEIVSPSAHHYIKAAALEDEVKEEDILKAERYILKTLEYTVSLYPQPMNWLRRISKADDYDPQVRTVAKFFLEIHVVERRLMAEKPSLLAAASIWLARLVLDHVDWTPNLAHYSGYSEKKIVPVANIMLNYCLRTEQHEHFQQKYASRKFNKASVFVNDWVARHWHLGDRISLIDELPLLKALATERKLQGLP